MFKEEYRFLYSSEMYCASFYLHGGKKFFKVFLTMNVLCEILLFNKKYSNEVNYVMTISYLSTIITQILFII